MGIFALNPLLLALHSGQIDLQLPRPEDRNPLARDSNVGTSELYP